MITIPSWLAFAVPAAFIAGLAVMLVLTRHDYDNGYTQAVADRRFPPSGLPDLDLDPYGHDAGELLPELPDWTGEQLRALAGDEPGETTGPFTITDLDGQAERIRRPVLAQLGPSFTSLPLPTQAELEQEWSWGKVAWQIVDLRRFVDQMPEGIAA